MRFQHFAVRTFAVLLFAGISLPNIALAAQAADAAPELSQRAIKQRAIEAVIWGMPAVNYDRMFLAAQAAGAGPNQILYWSRPSSWKNQTLTPNPNTIYLMPFIDTSSVGPVVLEIPPAEGGAIVGTVDDVWQAPIEDVGIAGVDKGKGGKYLILPPNYEEKVRSIIDSDGEVCFETGVV